MDAQKPITITAIPGLPEITPGFKLGAEVCARVDLVDDDILVISTYGRGMWAIKLGELRN